MVVGSISLTEEWWTQVVWKARFEEARHNFSNIETTAKMATCCT